MLPVSLGLFWHQHQPYYPDDVSRECLMPWVRLHGAKDYYGMAMHLVEVPEFRCTINLVPSLLVQILRYTEAGASDRHLDVSRIPAGDLSESDVVYLLDNFFMANVDNMIRPHARYFELYQKRGLRTEHALTALPRFSRQDLRDLQVWSNLTWFHALAFERDPDLRQFLEKGRQWTEDEKLWLLDQQMNLLRQIIPLHKRLADRGQVELTTTPFYHPILPLLWDKKSARQAMPGCDLPKHLDSYNEDAIRQLELAVSFHEMHFGEKPAGMWPSEGSVSQDVIAALADVGIKWFATDEEILTHSTDGFVSRDPSGHLRHPEMLYRPWLVSDGNKSLQIVFRDHGLSDLIGFHYQRTDPVRAADDLLQRLRGIGRAVEGRNAGRPALVPIILDGENCWEYYADGGVTFLRRLYQKAVSSEGIAPVRMRDHLQQYPAADHIHKLFAGSWISHNFAIWIGHREDNAAWDCLSMAREHLKAAAARGDVPPETLSRAWEELYIAEGSDWFWWYGDDHSSALDALFDQLFRKHLQNVYTLLGDAVPAILFRPITQAERRMIHTQPRRFSYVKFDGRPTFFEWIDAGRYKPGSERGTMTLVSEGLITELYFGFDATRLFIRMDTREKAGILFSPEDEVRVGFATPEGLEVRVTGFGGELATRLVRNQRAVSKHSIDVAADEIIEMGIPFEDLKVSAGDALHFFVEIIRNKHSLDRAPSEGAIELDVPISSFEQLMWQA
jgi:alpha-amylase/alpha-mannosidase (GH57 family)